ncbi:MAG: hypothetical protein LC753_13005 [Acidobacteria bacterium]|nr:hypothetical protein [Acidobacteriota bacterium]MCA1651147.1 hypothetical protein [Acidobacteriota bacterium]
MRPLMMIATCLLLTSFATAAPPGSLQAECGDVKACRQLALEAAERGDADAFHDLAWRALQKSRPNDPDLMYLIARAQSLSGRPHDALVMLRRLAEAGVKTDAATNDDFRRVRALPAWEPFVSETAVGTGDIRVASGAKSETSAVSKGAPLTARGTAESTGPDGDISFVTAPFVPAGLAYDSVSRRFIVSDREASKLMVIDEVSRRVSDMVAAKSGGFLGLTALEIDHRRGDLWVASAAADSTRTTLHKLQLVSGRVLHTVEIPASSGRLVDVAVTAGGAVFVLDAAGGGVFKVKSSTRGFERAIAVGKPGVTSLAVADERTLYVAHETGIVRVDLTARRVSGVRGGAPGRLAGLRHIRWHRGALVGVQATEDGNLRVIRIRLNRAGTAVTSVEPIEGAAGIVDPTALTVVDGVLFYLTRVNAGPDLSIRRLRLR